MIRKNILSRVILLLCLAFVVLAGCGAESGTTTLVTDSFTLSEEESVHTIGHGEEVEPFAEGSDPMQDQSSETVPVSEPSPAESRRTESAATESTVSKKESFLEKLFHREPTTLNDYELEIFRQMRLVYLVFKDDKLLAREKAKKIRDLLREVGCEVVVRFCKESAERAAKIFAEAAQEGAGTIIFDFPDLEIAEERVTPVLDAGVRFISLGALRTPSFSPSAVILPNETVAARALAQEAAGLFPNGSYFCVADKEWNLDLQEQFDEVLSAIGRPFARVAKYPYLSSESDEWGNLEGFSDFLEEYDDLRFVLCPDTPSARETARILKKLKRTDIGVLCLYGEGNILELVEKGYVKACGIYDTGLLSDSVMKAFDSLAEKGNAGDYSLCYVNTVVRTGGAE